MSSDDEGGASFDPNAWKSAPQSRPLAQAHTPAPTAPMVPPEAESEDELAADPLSTFRNGSAAKRRAVGTSTTTTQPAALGREGGRGSGFTSINRPSASLRPGSAISQSQSEKEVKVPAVDTNNVSVGDSDDEDGDDHTDEDEVEERRQSNDNGLVPMVSRATLENDEDEIVDMTAGEDVVRRVLAEVDSVGGEVVYKVELGDYSVEEVCPDPILPDTSPCHILPLKHVLGASPVLGGRLIARLAPSFRCPAPQRLPSLSSVRTLRLSHVTTLYRSRKQARAHDFMFLASPSLHLPSPLHLLTTELMTPLLDGRCPPAIGYPRLTTTN